MKISRWIFVPLFLSLAFGGMFFLFSGFGLPNLLFGLVAGGLLGLLTQFYSDYKIRQILPEATEDDFGVNRERKFVLFYDFEKSFEICLDSINQLHKGILDVTDEVAGTISATTGMSLNSNGNIVKFTLKRITETTTEVEVSTSPCVSMTLADGGNGLLILETLNEFFEKKNFEKTHHVLSEGTDTPIGAYFNEVNNIKVENK